MILETRIPSMTAQIRRSAIRAAEGGTESNDMQRLIVDLKQRGCRVTWQPAA